MGLAKVFEQVTRRRNAAGGGSRPIDGSRAGPPDADVRHRDPIAASAVLPGHARPATSAWPAPTSPATSRCTATCTPRWHTLPG